MIQWCTDPQVYITVVSDVDSLEFRTRTLIQGVTLLYIDRGHGPQVKPRGAYWPYTGHG